MAKKEIFSKSEINRILKRIFVDGRGRIIGRPLYSQTTRFELAVQRGLDRLRSLESSEQSLVNEQLTAVIKTFERPAQLRRLLSSIRRFFPRLSIIVVDDSREPQSHPGVHTIRMPFGSGVSAGRNTGVRHVSTPYVLILDDDFVFYRRTDLSAAMTIMESEPKIDIMGGAVVDLPFFFVTDYSQAPLFPTAAKAVLPPGSKLAGLPVYDKVPNFFIARTQSLHKVMWDEHLKRIDHADFFTRAKGVLISVYNEQMRCFHVKTFFQEEYVASRRNTVDDRSYLLKRYYGFTSTDTEEQSPPDDPAVS